MSQEIRTFILSEPEDEPVRESAAPKLSLLSRCVEWSAANAKIISWTAVGLFLLIESIWALSAGLQLRADIWQNTRTIHYNLDLYNMFNQGSNALRQAEHEAGLAPFADAQANQPADIASQIADHANQIGDTGAGPIRRLTYHEILHGVVHYYDEAASHPEQDPAGYAYRGLDYLPIRLAISAFWVRQVQRDHPTLFEYPVRPRPTMDTASPQLEDITQPLLRLNTFCELISALGMFALVWVWVWRSNRAIPRGVWKFWKRPSNFAFRLAAFREPKPFVYANGLVAFAVATAAFWYAYVGFAAPPMRPSPTVNVLRASYNGKSVIITGTVNDQASFDRWHIVWGDTESYTHVTPLRNLPPAQRDLRVQAQLFPVTSGETIHFALATLGAVGGSSASSRTQDFVFYTGSPQDNSTASTPTGTFKPVVQLYNVDPVGGTIWADWKIWLCIFALFITMVICARKLPLPHRAWTCGLVAALLVWFDPVTLLNSHAWPQWDVWILPFIVFAMLAASLDWWLTAGVIIGIGCLSKGQLLLAAPVLVLWPLFGGRMGAFLKILSGVAIGATVVLWPWLIRSDAGGRFLANIIEVAVPYACIVLAIRLAWPRIKGPGVGEESSVNPWHEIHSPTELTATKIARITLTVGLIFLTYCYITPPITSVPFKFLLLAVLTLPWFVDRSRIAFWLAGVIGGTVWTAAALCDGDFNWWKLGFVYGQEKHDRMQQGEGSFANLPAILLQHYGWDLHQVVGHLGFALHFPPYIQIFGHAMSEWNIDWGQDLDLKTCLAIVYFATLLLCSFAASVHARRNDPRTLVALIAPWLIFPIIMCQTSERYLLWASALTAAMIVVSTGFTLLHVLIAIFAVGMLGHQLLQIDVGRWPNAFNFFAKAYPDTGWMMLVLAGTFLAAAMVPSRRPISDELDLSEHPL